MNLVKEALFQHTVRITPLQETDSDTQRGDVLHEADFATFYKIFLFILLGTPALQTNDKQLGVRALLFFSFLNNC